MKFIHLTDTHLLAGDGELYGSNPKKRLQQAVTHLMLHQPDAEALVITGDLTHQGQADAYGQLREVLSSVTKPIYLIPGNHDHRETLKEYFPSIECDKNGFIQYTKDFGDYLAIFLDTNEPGVPWGVFCDMRGAWLREQLEASTKPVMLFMHHPFFTIGIHSMDNISLRDTAAFRTAIAGFESCIRQVFFGHIHRPITGSYQGMPFFTLRGTNHQVALELHADAEEGIPGRQEAPQYAVVQLSAGQVLIHIEDFLDDSVRFRLKG
ncbi:phosphodiesterase [Alcaligenaceae bacterium]|nr:phosphodiesterase [Alcaligenaceae bacterium]